MVTVMVTVTNPIGLHARPASRLVNLLKGYACNIEFYKNGNDKKKYQPKSIISVMASGSIKGDVLIFEANGKDENEAIKAVEDFIKNGCGE